jgi:DNA-binding CsgD family transcriptional regulator
MVGSSYVRTEDVRELLSLFWECHELAGARERAEPHFLTGLARIARAQIAIQVDVDELRSDRPPMMKTIHDVGWASTSDRDRVYEFVSRERPDADPTIRAALTRAGGLVTVTRSDALSDSAWARTTVRNEVHRPSSVDDVALSLLRKCDGSASVLLLKRAWGEPPFGPPERELLGLAHAESGRVFQTNAERACAPEYSPRERETLDLLLTGLSEKRIAATLGISPHTVHNYVKVIFRKAGVGSRAELMARMLARAEAR